MHIFAFTIAYHYNFFLPGHPISKSCMFHIARRLSDFLVKGSRPQLQAFTGLHSSTTCSCVARLLARTIPLPFWPLPDKRGCREASTAHTTLVSELASLCEERHTRPDHSCCRGVLILEACECHEEYHHVPLDSPTQRHWCKQRARQPQ